MEYKDNTVNALCEGCNCLVEVKVRRAFDANGYLRMTTFECQNCDLVEFVQAPHPNSPAGLAKREMAA